MSSSSCSLAESPFEHVDWPDSGRVALVLDGVSIQNLSERIYQWAGDSNVEAECLYVTTRWEVLSELSPWLVWLTGPEDPVLRGFLQQGPEKEQGYIVVSRIEATEFTRWMRLRLQVERAPGYEELMRISHPALARSVIGEGLIQTAPAGAVSQLMTPDMIRGQWVTKAPRPVPPGGQGDSSAMTTCSAELEQAFEAFNRRRQNLLIWQSLDKEARCWLGGPSLKDAYPALCKVLQDASRAGCNSLKDMARFLFDTMAQQATAQAETGLTFH